MLDRVGRHLAGSDGHDVAAALGRRRPQHLPVPPGDVHSCAVCGEGLRDGQADAGAAASDDALEPRDREELGGEKSTARHFENRCSLELWSVCGSVP